MNLYSKIKDNLSQILALTEKNIQLDIRFRSNLILSYLTYLMSIIISFIVMRKFFEFNDKFGPWTIGNFFIFQFLAYNLLLLNRFIDEYPRQFQIEKFWRTIDALIIAPFNRFNLLCGIFLSQLILIAIPITIVFMLCYIFYPISLLTFFIVLFLYFLIAMIFSCLGLFLAIFTISNENLWHLFRFIINCFIWFSCITYPFEIFPEEFQGLINLNPFYYIYGIIRFVWIEDNIVSSFFSHSISFLILLIYAIILPCISVYLFNKIFKKFGIVGNA